MTTSSNNRVAGVEPCDWEYARAKNRELFEKTYKQLPIFFWLNCVATFIGVALMLLGARLAFVTPIWQTPAIVSGSFGVVVSLFGAMCLFVYKSTLAEVKGYINEPVTTDEWEAARRKIQYYMHENLNQVRWIFWLTLVAMFLGFLIILCGAALAIIVQNQLAPSIVVTLSGVLVEFLGATFLVIYRSTMDQAKGYVKVLERINSIGLSVKQVEKIEPSKSADILVMIALQILSLHGSTKGEESE